ncbi:MAG: SRPBCC family protein [Actinophytocola sp.]|uniref:SRPBCC family protein n=1 Tax=Actinophytocola sp. TaxID=1872138 RepID=UPI001322D820|nr:SRPBCC family protein [Actinophytocola sp.]MPZ86065.1 SRPBCC family protein [Actinophytocola sp.]
MPPIESTIDIACPADVVFAYATDPTRFPEWQKDVVRVRLAAGRPSTVGSTFTTTRWIGRTERTTTQEITEVVPPRRWAARGVDGPIRPSASITVDELDGGSTSRVTFTLDFEGHGIGVPLVPLVRRQAQKAAPGSYRNLKERLESGATTG